MITGYLTFYALSVSNQHYHLVNIAEIEEAQIDMGPIENSGHHRLAQGAKLTETPIDLKDPGQSGAHFNSGHRTLISPEVTKSTHGVHDPLRISKLTERGNQLKRHHTYQHRASHDLKTGDLISSGGPI